MYAIIETHGEDLEVEMLDDSDYLRSSDGTVLTFETYEEASAHAMATCMGFFEVVPYGTP